MEDIRMNRSVKGLIIKDFQLMKSQMKFFFFLMIAYGIFMASSLNMVFFVGYIAILCAYLVVGTFSYDAFENGYAYLFTLPVSRKDYVVEKFVFGVLLTMIPFLVVSVVSWVALVVRGSEMRFGEYCLSVVISLPLAFLMLALEIPLQIKFGQEKSRIVSILLIGGMSVAMGLVSSLNEIAGVNIAELLSSIAGLGIGGILLMVVVVLVVLLLLSYKISCWLMEKKEF